MKAYFYKGTASAELRTHILSHGVEFTSVMAKSVEAFGGKVLRCHLSANGGEPHGFLEFPDEVAAYSWNAFYSSQEGVLSSEITRLLDTTDLTEANSLIQERQGLATVHRGKA